MFTGMNVKTKIVIDNRTDERCYQLQCLKYDNIKYSAFNIRVYCLFSTSTCSVPSFYLIQLVYVFVQVFFSCKFMTHDSARDIIIIS